jgi:PRTRC genetic system protein C
MTATTTELQRIFRMGAVDLPDPDRKMSPESVLAHYTNTFPNLMGGKVAGGNVEGNNIVFTLKRNEYKANG